MEFLYQKLPKDLVYIIEDYAKDRTNYDEVIHEFENKHISHAICEAYKQSNYNECECKCKYNSMFIKFDEDHFIHCDMRDIILKDPTLSKEFIKLLINKSLRIFKIRGRRRCGKKSPINQSLINSIISAAKFLDESEFYGREN
jgi:hypothetical protein